MAKGNKNNAADAKKVKGSKHIGLIIFLVIILVLGYLAFTYGSLPYAVLTAKNRNASTLASIMLSSLNSAKTASVSYNGSVTVNSSDPNVLFVYTKNSSRIYMEMQILQNNGGFDEVNATLTNLTKPGIVCTLHSHPNQPYLGPSCVYAKPFKPFLNVTNQIAELQTLNNVSIKSFGLQSVGGQACYKINGTATVMLNGTLVGTSGYVPASLNFSGCLSAQYNIPLEIKGYAKAQNGVYVFFSFKDYGFLYYGSTSVV